jgi:hypothetical protein
LEGIKEKEKRDKDRRGRNRKEEETGRNVRMKSRDKWK